MSTLLTPDPGGFDWMPLWVSLRVGVTATAIGMVVGTLVGYALAHGRLPGRKILESAVLLPLVLPPTVLGFFLLVIVGRRSPIGHAWESVFGTPLVFTFQAAVLAACVATIPLVARTLSAAFASANRDVLEAARLDGARGLSLLWHVHLPLIRPHLLAAATIAFARAVGDFGTTLMVAGSIPGETRTAAIAIYDLIAEGQDAQALVLVGAMSALSLLVLVVASRHRPALD